MVPPKPTSFITGPFVSSTRSHLNFHIITIGLKRLIELEIDICKPLVRNISIGTADI
jgi:hypothetical protein